MGKNTLQTTNHVKWHMPPRGFTGYKLKTHPRHPSFLPLASGFWYDKPKMAPSSFPFHGIFSALGQEPTEETPQMSPRGTSPHGGQRDEGGIGRIAVDIYEQDNYYIIKAPIAGVKMNDLDIEISDNIITIRGVRQQTDSVPNDQYYLQECFWGPFSRSVTLPFPIDPKKVKATFNKECILKILIPKEEKVKIVRINEG